MKMILKVLALPVLFLMKSVCILGNLLSNISSFVIGLILLMTAVTESLKRIGVTRKPLASQNNRPQFPVIKLLSRTKRKLLKSA